ncbi:MAG TPA: hypothetical protein VGG25_24370 [Streptosporangiaceae bacterium]
MEATLATVNPATWPGGDDAARHARHRARYRELAGEYARRPDWSAGQILAERQRALRELIAVAKARSPWHARRLAGIDPREVTEGNLAGLPVMTKADLMENFDEIVTDRRLTRRLCESHLESADGGRDAWLLGEYHVVASGGSSGLRGVFVYGWDAWAICYSSIVRFQRRAWAADPALADVPRRTAVVAGSSPRHLSSAINLTFSRPRAGGRALLSVGQRAAEIVAGLNRIEPTVLMCYSSFLPALAAQAADGRLRIAPRQVIGLAEPLLPEISEVVAAAWGVRPVSNYGMSEGLFARSCGQGLHLPDDLCITEPAGPGGAVVGPGTPSRTVYVTNLYNPVLPLIRMEVTDEVTVLAQGCPCGCAFKLIGAPQGRLDELFGYPGGLVVHPHVFRARLSTQPGILAYQVRQTPGGADIAIVPAPGAAAGAWRGAIARIEAQVTAALADIGLPGAQVRVTAAGALERTAAGKLRRFVPLPP